MGFLVSVWGWEGQQDGTGSEGRLQKAVTQDSTILKANMEANPWCVCREKCSSSCVLFFLVVVAILSSVKKHTPPLAPDGTKAPLSVSAPQWGRVCVRTKEQEREGGSGNGLLRKMTQRFFYMDVFHLFFSFTLPSSLPSLSHILCPPPPLFTSELRERSLFPPSVLSVPPTWPLTRKKNPWQKAEMNTNC